MSCLVFPAFKSHIQACGEITPVMKLILRKFSKYRTEEEIKLMGKIVKRLKVFDKYPQMIKEELGRILYYDVFEDGRLISKQGRTRTKDIVKLSAIRDSFLIESRLPFILLNPT